MRRSKANNKKKNVTRRRKEKNSQFEKVTTRGASHHQRVSLNTNNNNKRWEGTVSRGPQRGGKENGQRSLTSFQQKKKTFESVVRPQSKGLLHERKFFFSFFLIILLPETTFVIREWNRKCRIFHQPKRQQRIHLSGLLKKKKWLYVYLWSRGTRANRAARKGAERLAIDMPRYIPLLMVRRSTRKGRPHNTACWRIITCVWHACYSTRMTAFSRFFLLAQPRTPSLLYMSCVFCKLFRAKVALLL